MITFKIVNREGYFTLLQKQALANSVSWLIEGARRVFNKQIPYMVDSSNDLHWTLDDHNDWQLYFSEEDARQFSIVYRYEEKRPKEQALAAWLSVRLEGLKSLPYERDYTIFCRESNGSGTTYITMVRASSVEGAKRKGLAECIDSWNAGSDTGAPYTEDNVTVIGVAKGDVKILEWEDIDERLH